MPNEFASPPRFKGSPLSPLRLRRLACGLPLVAFARSIGVPSSSLSLHERNLAELDAEQAARVEAALARIEKADTPR